MQLKPDNSKMENFKIIEEKENPLFNRREIQFNVEAKITPSRAEVGKLILEKFPTQIENIKIKEIHGRFGSNNFKVTTFIYGSEQDKNKVEIKKKKDDLIKPKEMVEEKPKEEVENKESQDEEKNVKSDAQKEEASSKEPVKNPETPQEDNKAGDNK